ncbi:hypothetical protein PLESTB_001557700 [Pleodorina starrii]|uniref:Uncharacterized protein n=1 Tax=Pleodorina starrii TaxID=330485 RepID=A0A9W6F880_9CHLO|nr:hypothetical protein PLESTM_001473700 [Pleodorina starrii]GLC59954.1 hypothetical protein PLESTB_001557700 [Pleodorina starrii]GLC72817.1 hypothetical protein PLESTF_001296400 [Pleodorina starrii]
MFTPRPCALARKATGVCTVGAPFAVLPARHRVPPSLVLCRASPRRQEEEPSEQKALAEAASMFEQARTMAHLQTQHELEQAFLADLDLTATAAPPEPAPRRAMVSFWCEQGLSSGAAEQLVRRLEESGRRYNVEQVSAKVQRLNRILPDADVPAMVERELEVLDVDSGLAIRNMVVLVEAFPGRQVTDLIQRQPRLLVCPDLPERKERVLELLTKLHPSRDRKVVAGVVGEYPDLLFRMDYYKHARMIDELPIEIQNMFVLADQGIGFLHRYYKRARNNFVADTSDEEAGF